MAYEYVVHVTEFSLKNELERLSKVTDSRCIHRVPPRLRLVCEKAYTPQVVSIGPLHHGEKTLKVMEEHKLRYLQYFLGRPNNLSLVDYIKKIKDREVELRSCYSEAIELSSEEFVKIILVDAIFLIEFLFRRWYPDLLDVSDCIFGKPRISEDAWLDLLMLENQLPFFILQDLFNPDIFSISPKYPEKPDAGKSLSIMFLSYHFLATHGVYNSGTLATLETIRCSGQKVQHFVDLSRRMYIAQGFKTDTTTRVTSSRNVPTIEELLQAGVKLKVSSSNSLFDIQFKHGCLEIPRLKITDSTQTTLRNLIAYEQCLDERRYMCDYVFMLDKLVDTPKDVGLLEKYEIVDNYLGGGDDELSTMINSITTGVNISFRNYYYGTLYDDLNKHCRSLWHERLANLRQNYFNTPWTTISFIAAALLLILTMIQTVCTVASC